MAFQFNDTVNIMQFEEEKMWGTNNENKGTILHGSRLDDGNNIKTIKYSYESLQQLFLFKILRVLTLLPLSHLLSCNMVPLFSLFMTPHIIFLRPEMTVTPSLLSNQKKL